MPTKRSTLSPAKLRDAFVTDLAAAWAHFTKKHPNHTPYACVLYGTEGGCPSLVPQVLTEEGLTQVAQRYVDMGHHDTIEEARASLRYSVADSPFFSDLLDDLPTVNALFGPHAEALGDDDGYKVLAKTGMDALAKLDGNKLFGDGAQ